MSAREWSSPVSDEVRERWERIDRLMLRVEAGCARRLGIDVFQPGWRDEYLAFQREQDDIARLIATPHVDQAIDDMEEQFSGGAS